MAAPPIERGPAEPGQLPEGAAKTMNDNLQAAGQAAAQGAQGQAGPNAEGVAAAAPNQAMDENLQAQMAAMQSGVTLGAQPAPPIPQGAMDEVTQFHTAPDPNAGGFVPNRTQQAPPPNVAASLPYLQAAAAQPDAPPALKLLLQHILYHQGTPA
jgi:hypothetical protein